MNQPASQVVSSETPDGSDSPRTAWPYLAPMGIFLLLTSLESYLPRAADGTPAPVIYALYYAVKIAAVVIALAAGRQVLRDLRKLPTTAGFLLAVGLGLVVAAAWVGIERLPYPRIPLGGDRQAFDPASLSGTGRWLFLATRMLGLVVVVPVVEELFWRSFLMRWLIDPDFWKVAIGRVTWMAAGVTSLLFAAAHPEWLPALLTGLAWAGLLAYTGSLTACLVSHAVANLALGAYVLTTGAWQLW